MASGIANAPPAESHDTTGRVEATRSRASSSSFARKCNAGCDLRTVGYP